MCSYSEWQCSFSRGLGNHPAKQLRHLLSVHGNPGPLHCPNEQYPPPLPPPPSSILQAMLGQIPVFSAVVHLWWSLTIAMMYMMSCVRPGSQGDALKATVSVWKQDRGRGKEKDKERYLPPGRFFLRIVCENPVFMQADLWETCSHITVLWTFMNDV